MTRLIKKKKSLLERENNQCRTFNNGNQQKYRAEENRTKPRSQSAHKQLEYSKSST